MKSKSIDILFLSAFLFIGITLYTTYSSVRKQESFNDLVDHTYLVKNKILDLESEFRSMISNQRSYMFSEDTQYLKVYRDRSSALDQMHEELLTMTQDNPDQQKNLKDLKKSLNDTRYVLNQQLKLFENGGLFSNRKVRNHINETDQYADSFLNTIRKMSEVENELLKERIYSQDAGERLTPYTFTLLGVLSFAIIAFAFFKQKASLTEKNELLKNKRHLLKNLLNSNADLEEYAYLASHDLKEPLRKIQIFSDTAQIAIDRDNPDDVRKYLQKIDKSANDAARMVDGLLSHAQLEKNEKDLSLNRLSDLFGDVAAEFRTAHEPDIKFSISSEETPMLMVYESQIKDLFRNLFSNAVKFRKEGDLVEIKMTCDQVNVKGEEYYRVSFVDNGVGFDQNYAGLLFEMFNKLNLHQNSKKNNTGLSLCKKVMDNHHGKIEAHSVKNEGSTFHLLFPKIV
ncbi:CHASE3 domain-containing protein [Jiulongibacter sediminis]|uniref:sensor histidine kinase n=1 Tax=Jiulongibacter sediminis TaxID=1605367 RepID=UPI0026EF9788|nr:CHASE3 domain-containing protein [Jiulongibacter sediminis]